MGNNNQKRNAEDILTEDILIENLINHELKKGQFPEEEIAFAGEIYQSFNEKKIDFQQDKKNLLDQRILYSIHKYKRKKALTLFGSAAGLLVLIGLTFFFQRFSQSAITDFASNISVKPGAEYTRLLVAGTKEIQIDTKESKIEYSENGTAIKIDDQKDVDQQSEATSQSFNSVIVPYGKRSQITLPDNSKIWLNSGSKLVYPVQFAGDKREVYLEGEAMFEVNPDKNHPFYVLSRDFEVKVLGTVFNLCAYSDDPSIQTVLESGSVELRYNNHFLLGPAKEVMVPGMLAVYNPEEKTIVQTKVNTKDYTSWKDGYVILEKNTLGSIIRKLSRYYNVSIELDNQELAGETFSGYLDLRNSAIQVLEVIAEMVDIEIVQFDHLIKIRKRENPG